MGRGAGRGDDASQRFTLRADGRDYLLEVRSGVRHRARLLRDGEEIASGAAMDERLTLSTRGGGTRVDVRVTRLGRVRRATLRLGSRELDLDPEPGSRAATRMAKEREHPVRYAALDVLAAAAGILLPLLGLGALLQAFLEPVTRWIDEHRPHVDLPDLPDLPRIPWPDIPWPSIDLSWLPDWDPPPWLVWALDHIGDLTPVLVAVLVARHEIRRRRRQDEIKATLAEEERRRLLQRLAVDLRRVTDRAGGGMTERADPRPGDGSAVSCGDGIRSRGDRPDP